MSRIIYYVASSLDGFIADENGGVAWLDDFSGQSDFGYAEFVAGVDALLMGRRTYEQVRGFGEWPYAGKAVRVWTRRPLEDAPELVSAVAGPAGQVARGLAVEGFRRVWLVGGAELAEALRREGLIDEWIVSVIPRSLGAGVPLFGGVETGLAVSEVRSFPGPLLQLHMTSTR
ncbi:dihydrofolate reductase [bacterium]|nr:MAG: dihydrofolate reductase [bacterium]RKZ14949.1 MAG: dihydrofolate reductase [bacterium]